MSKPLFIVRRLLPVLLLLVVVIGTVTYLLTRTDEPESEDIIIDKVVEKPQAGPQRMGVEENNGSVTWVGGAEYSYTITRQSADSLGIIVNHDKKYYDNTVVLTVKRTDGSTFFTKKFTKANFAPVLPKQFMETGVLLGMNLLKAEGNELHFVVNVGSPDDSNEEFYYVQMTLDNFGSTRAEVFKPRDKDE